LGQTQTATYAGPVFAQPFHTTALCSPSRVSLLTSRNHHTVGIRGISNWDTGYPHMRSAVTRRAAMLPELLPSNGYATYAVGKWRLAPIVECSAAGPHDNWPLLQRGFDPFYGFMQGETNQFHPELTVDNHHIDPPATPANGYHVSEDLVDCSVAMINDLNAVLPERPFLLWLAFGATHSPHQAPKEYLQRWCGWFNDSWDLACNAVFVRQKEMGVVPPNAWLADRNC
jgi:arylsulfatase A-like enzyme